FLKTGLRYAELTRAQAAAHAARNTPAQPETHMVDGAAAAPADAIAVTAVEPSVIEDLDAKQHEAEVRWRVARKNMHIAFGNFAAAFYRMMDEPIKRQNNVPELNNLLIQNHVLASQITSAVPILAGLDHVPEGIRKSLEAVELYLDDKDAEPPVSIETEGELAALAYPLRQMVKAAQLIRQEMRGLQTADDGL